MDGGVRSAEGGQQAVDPERQPECDNRSVNLGLPKPTTGQETLRLFGAGR